MNITILLHSTTGNTRLVAEFAAQQLAARGHHCRIHDIVKSPDTPSLDDTDLLGVACPTMYFRPTLAMERFIARLNNNAGAPRAAFQLATCGGEPGAHFAIAAELLAYKGYHTLAAHWVLAPSNYPTHLYMVKPLAWSAKLARPLTERLPRSWRALWGVLWPACAEPDNGDRDALAEFLQTVLEKTERGRLAATPPLPDQLHRTATPGMNTLGRMIHQEWMEQSTCVRIVAEHCTRCGICVKQCPVHIIAQDYAESVPQIGHGCSGCFSCFNHCPAGAIRALATPAGWGRYKGPSEPMRAVFAPAAVD